MEKLLLKIPEVCEITGLGRSKLYQLFGAPGGLTVVHIGKAVRVPAAEVEAWVARQVEEAKAGV